MSWSGLSIYGVAGLPSAPRLVSAGGRFRAFLLDSLLVVVTLGVGWLVWTLISWSSGQTRAKQILKMVVVDATAGHPLNWGHMFWREFIIRGLGVGILSGFTFGLLGLVDALMVLREGPPPLHDLAAGTSVSYL